MNVKVKKSKAVHYVDLDVDLEKVPKVYGGLNYRTACGKPAPFTAVIGDITCKVCKGSL